MREALHIREVFLVHLSSHHVSFDLCRLIINLMIDYQEFDDIEWTRCNDSMTFDFDWNCVDTKDLSYTHNVVSSVNYHQRLVDKHCRALIYR